MDKNSLAAEDRAIESVETEDLGQSMDRQAEALEQTEWQRNEAQRRAERALLAQAQAAILSVESKTPMDSLLGKLDEWLLQQPEWPLILYAPRNVRRDAAKLVAKHLLTIPTRRT